MERKEFIAEVRKELKHIKANATKEELDRLNIKTLNPKNSNHCIYGQMTGHCSNDRAKELYPKSKYHIEDYTKVISCTDVTALEVYIYEHKFTRYASSKLDKETIDTINNVNTRHLNHILRYLKGELVQVTLK